MPPQTEKAETRLPSRARLLHREAGGESWLLTFDEAGEPSVDYRGRDPGAAPSGRHSVAAFLRERAGTPAQRELLRLIGTLVDEGEASPETS